MKIKTFILTFLLMSCPFLFGQSHWDFNEQNVYPNSMGILAKVSVNSTPLEDYELGAFVNGELRGSNQLEEGNNGFVFLSIHGNGNETVTLKAYDKNTGVTYENVYTINFNSNLNNSAINIDVVPVAQVGSEKVYYTKLSDALTAATAGQTVTFLNNITEDVTVNKAVTIDGAKFTYTGKMTLKADATIKNVNFDGKGYNGYAVETRGAQYVTIEECTAANYGYGFVQLASATALTTVKNVTVSDMNYGVKVDYSGAVVLENVDMTAAVAAVLNSNYGEKTITIKGSYLNILGTWKRNDTTKTTYVFEGENSIDSFITEAAIDNFKLALGATLTAPEGLTVTTDVENYVVVYKDGKYSLFQKILSGTWGGIDWTFEITNLEDKSGTLTIAPTKGEPVPDKNAPTKRTYKVGEWRETVIYKSNGSASAIGGAPYDMKAVKQLIIEEGVTKIGSFTGQFPNLTGKVVIPSTVTYIGQEAFHKAPMTSLVFAAGGTEPLCIANGAFKKTLIEEVSFPGDREYIHIHHWAFGGSPNLKTAYIPANLTKVWGGEHVDYFDNFNSQTNVSWTNTGSIFTGCNAMETITFETEEIRDFFFAGNRQDTAEDPMVAAADLVAYNSLDKAIAAATDDIILCKSATLKDTWTIDKNLTINGNGKTLTYSGSDRAIDVPSKADAKVNVTINNLTVNCTASYCQRGINYNDNGALVLNKVTVKGTNVTYALNLPGSSDEAIVTINDSNLSGNIALNVWGEEATINAENSTFTAVDNNTAEGYAAVKLNNDGATSAEGTVINICGGKIDVTGDACTDTEAVSNGTSTGVVTFCDDKETTINGEIAKMVAVIRYANDQSYSFTKLADAIKKAQDGETVIVINNIEEENIVVIDKAITLDLNGKTITSEAKKAFEVYDNATITSTATDANGKIINGTINGANRCVDTRKAVELTLSNVTLVADEYTSAFGNPQPLTIGGSEHGTEVNMTNVNISAAAGYGIITFVKTELTATNSTIGGYNALYVKPGSDNSTFNFVNSTLSGSTVSNDVEGNSFTTIAVRANNVTVNADAESKVNADGNYCYALSFGSEYAGEESCSYNDVTIAGTIDGNIISEIVGEDNVIKVNAKYADELNAAGFATSTPEYGLVTVLGEAVAKVGETIYATLAAAVEAAQKNGTVTLLRDATGAGVVINKNITIDFDGFTYSFNEGVGSTSTESNGFQIIKGNTVTLKNGTLDVAAEAKEKFYILVQNYADLNVTNMTLDGTNLDKWSTTDGDSYVLSNNSGTVNIEGTTITANDEGNKAFAFDVCDHKSYQGGTTVNVANTENRETVVTGKIEVTGEGDADLNISGGLFTTEIEEAWCAEGYVPTNKFVDGKEYYTVTGKQTFKLAQHWNWFSSYLNIELSQLQTALGTSGKEIKHNDNTTSYEEGYWLTAGNPLTSVEASKMYMIQTSVAIDIELTGEVVDPSEVNITLQNNWNWIGYPLANPYTVKEVMAASNLEPKDGDQIKSHLDGFAQYMVVEGIGGNWYGTLKTMKPGCGYMYGNNNGGVRTLTFAYPNVNPSTRGTVEANITAENNHWAPTAQFASNMTMIATLGADSENYELAAFVNGEVRGSARPIYVEALDAYMFFLTIHGEGVEEVTFKCYDIDTDTEYTLNEGIVYSSDAILGSVREPYVLRGTLGMDEVSANEVAIYPNPTTTANEIMLSTTCDKVEVFNSLGVKVAEYQNVDTIEALETAGVYVIRVTNNDNVQNCRLVVK